MDPTQAIGEIDRAKNVLVSAHVNPDGDAVGSLLATGLVMRKLRKGVVLYLESDVPDLFRFLPHLDEIRHRIEGIEEFDLAIILDCSDLTRVGVEASRIGGIPRILNVDHHLYNQRFGTVNLVDTAACATASILFDLFKRLDVELDRDIAEGLYTGILTDTGSFRYENTTGVTFSTARELVRFGVDPARIAREVYLTIPLKRIRLLSRALDSVECLHGGRIGVMALSARDFREVGAEPPDAEGFIDYVRGIPGVEVAVLFKELEARAQTGVSLRAWGDTNVADIARFFQGGGHKKAAGFRIEGSILDHKDRVLSRIAAYMDGAYEAKSAVL